MKITSPFSVSSFLGNHGNLCQHSASEKSIGLDVDLWGQLDVYAANANSSKS